MTRQDGYGAFFLQRDEENATGLSARPESAVRRGQPYIAGVAASRRDEEALRESRTGMHIPHLPVSRPHPRDVRHDRAVEPIRRVEARIGPAARPRPRRRSTGPGSSCGTSAAITATLASECRQWAIDPRPCTGTGNRAISSANWVTSSSPGFAVAATGFRRSPRWIDDRCGARAHSTGPRPVWGGKPGRRRSAGEACRKSAGNRILTAGAQRPSGHPRLRVLPPAPTVEFVPLTRLVEVHPAAPIRPTSRMMRGESRRLSKQPTARKPTMAATKAAVIAAGADDRSATAIAATPSASHARIPNAPCSNATWSGVSSTRHARCTSEVTNHRSRPCRNDPLPRSSSLPVDQRQSRDFHARAEGAVGERQGDRRPGPDANADRRWGFQGDLEGLPGRTRGDACPVAMHRIQQRLLAQADRQRGSGLRRADLAAQRTSRPGATSTR